MRIVETALPGVVLIQPKRFEDSRGFFAETWNHKIFAELGLDLDFVQDNHSLSVRAGTIRGLHLQLPPFAQDKLVRVLRGSILDVAVDVRPDSRHFGQHVAVRLDASDGTMLLAPAGFAHGFCTLEPNTEVAYKVTALYAPSHDRGIIWNDPALGIAWPVPADSAVLSDRDRAHPPLSVLRAELTARVGATASPTPAAPA